MLLMWLAPSGIFTLSPKSPILAVRRATSVWPMPLPAGMTKLPLLMTNPSPPPGAAAPPSSLPPGAPPAPGADLAPAAAAAAAAAAPLP
jgi:hypothetical protein